MNKTIQARTAGGKIVDTTVLFTGEVKDADEMFFVVSTSDNVKLSEVSEKSAGILIGYGHDDFFKEDSDYWTDVLPFTGSDDKKVIAAQLRELADWLEKQ